MSTAAQAQIARVLDTKGTALVERSGQVPRLLGAGERLDERDVINVARDSWAILEFNDQTRVTLRPNTVFRLDSYRADAPEAMLLGLVKGGLRAVTGLLGKRNPSGVKVHTAVATIGIRGTEFDARLCADDCAAEERARPALRPLVLPAARVVEMVGVAAAGRAGEPVRLLVPGSMLNEGDAVAIGGNGGAVLVFRDGARVTLAANSRFAINHFRYEESPRSGSAFLTLYAGNVLFTTGELAKISPDAFLFRTALGVIRPFGTTVSGGGCIRGFCADVSVTVNSDGASASGSTSGGGTSASGSTSVGADGASASGTASTGGNTASGSTGTLVLPVSGTPEAPSAQEFVNEVIAGVSDTLIVILNTTTTQGQNMQQQANNLGTSAQNQLQETTQNVTAALVTQAVNALNTATAPIVAQMTTLMMQMRNNPPQTQEAAQQMQASIAQLSQQLRGAMSAAQVAAGAIAQNDAFRSSIGMFEAQLLAFYSYTAAGFVGVAVGTAALTTEGLFRTELDRVRSDPYLLGCVGLVGLSDADLMEARNASGHSGYAVIEREVVAHLASQGSAAAKAFFAEAKAGITVAQQRAEQEAARVAAEAARLAAEAKAAAEAKLAAELAAAEKLAAEQRQRAADEAARKLAQAEFMAKRQAEIALNKAVNSLNSAAAPIVRQITTLMAQLRNNPPQTEAAKQQFETQMQALRDQLRLALDRSVVAAGELANSPAVKAAYGMYDLVMLESFAAQAIGVDAAGDLVAKASAIGWREQYFTYLESIRADPYRASNFALIGISDVDIARALPQLPPIQRSMTSGPILVARSVLLSESSVWMADSGATAVRAMLAEAQAVAVAAQQRAEQEAARVAAEAARLAAEAKAAAEVELAATQRGEIRLGGMRVRGSSACLDHGDCRIIARVPGTPAPFVPAPYFNTPLTPYLDYLIRRGDENYQEAGSEQSSTDNIATVAVWEGSVEVVGKGRLAQGEMFAPNGELLRLAARNIEVIKIDAGLFTSHDKAVEEGLYVWVRDGAVSVSKDDKIVDVPAGNAAVATKDKVELLDTVPNFLRFDQTPKPSPAFGDTRVDAFRAEDGSLLNMCSVR